MNLEAFGLAGEQDKGLRFVEDVAGARLAERVLAIREGAGIFCRKEA